MYRSLPRLRLTFAAPAILAGLLVAVSAAQSPGPRVLPEGRLPDDRRLGPLVDLNGYFPFTPCVSRDVWSERAGQLRRQLLVAAGLWPMPTRTPPEAVVHGRVDRDGYTVEKVYLESYPGHFVTGNLYRPKGRSGRVAGRALPARALGRRPVLRRRPEEGPAGDRRGGRAVRGRRATLRSRPAACNWPAWAAWSSIYDMVGYADSVQLAHGPGSRPAMNTPENWGYFSPQAELRLANDDGPANVQLDPRAGLAPRAARRRIRKRIAVTGASGGGTQTFILCAIDPRPAVAFPAVMVSTAMQGGCTCENACYLRVGTGNVEIAALIAPRPLGMTAADDWTKEIATKGLPELKQLYRLLGVEDLVMAKPLLQFPHNYNYVSRAVMYHWMNKHLEAGPAGADRRRGFPAALDRRDERLGRRPSQAARRRRLRAVAAAMDHPGHRAADGGPGAPGRGRLGRSTARWWAGRWT